MPTVYCCDNPPTEQPSLDDCKWCKVRAKYEATDIECGDYSWELIGVETSCVTDKDDEEGWYDGVTFVEDPGEHEAEHGRADWVGYFSEGIDCSGGCTEEEYEDQVPETVPWDPVAGGTY